MKKSTALFRFACALPLAASCALAQAAVGDVFVPAHRTRDGSFVPANVPPSSGGTHVSSHLGKSAVARRDTRRGRNGIVAPIFIQAKVVQR